MWLINDPNIRFKNELKTDIVFHVQIFALITQISVILSKREMVSGIFLFFSHPFFKFFFQITVLEHFCSISAIRSFIYLLQKTHHAAMLAEQIQLPTLIVLTIFCKSIFLFSRAILFCWMYSIINWMHRTFGSH